jgi:hypothetical protein
VRWIEGQATAMHWLYHSVVQHAQALKLPLTSRVVHARARQHKRVEHAARDLVA